MNHSPDCCCGCALAADPEASSTPHTPTSTEHRPPGRTPVHILGTGAYVPDRVVTNTEVGAPAGVDDTWILAKTGIRTRRWAHEDDATSDLAAAAARHALADAAIDPAQISAIIVATSTPDRPQPPTAAFVQHKIGAPQAYAFDVNAVCTGFLFALDTAAALAQRDRSHVLVVAADMYSTILDRSDRRTACLFGDGAGAVVIGPARGKHLLHDVDLFTFGDIADLITVPAGGSEHPLTPALLAEGQQYFHMNGRGVRDFITASVPDLVTKFLARNHLAHNDIDHVIAHQANGRILDELEKDLNLPNARFHRTVETLGNTGAASLPVTLHRSTPHLSGRTLALAFGGGMAAGLALITTT